ncbi:MAG: fatty acid desaturase [Cyclobacteriaceae bacterium]
MLRYLADVRSVVYMIVTTSLLVVLWQWSSQMNQALFILLYSMQLVLAVSVSVMTHNHQHLTMWKNKWLNVLTDNWLSVFYGFPVYAWIPTHNMNHHRHINTQEDYTRTFRYSEKNNLLTLLSYPSISGYFQQKAVGTYFKGLKSKNKEKYYLCWLQWICVISVVVVALIVDWKKALIFVVVPQQVSMFAVLIFNYIQHVHADEEDEFNNSRNFTGAIMNFVLLNNGYHTAHHVATSLHWSELPEKHKELAPKIDPVLNVNNFAWFMFSNYILGIFIPSMRTKSRRVARMKKIDATAAAA